MSNSYRPFRFSRSGLKGLKPSPTLSMNDRVQEMRAAGREVYHLGFGESRFQVHPLVAKALQDNAQQRSYLPALGIPELRQTIATFYERHFNLPVAANQVVIGPGSKSLLYALLVALDGDIIMPTPAWSSYQDLATLSGRLLLEVPMDPGDDYRLDVNRLQGAMSEAAEQWRRPDLLLFSTPHNPTSTTLSLEETQKLTDFARDRELMILSDEIYGMVTYDSAGHVSPAHTYADGTIVFGGLSKHMSLGGWRFGVAILPPTAAGVALERALKAIAGCIWSCVTAPVQFAAQVAYGDNPQVAAYMQACTEMHAARTRYLYDALLEFGVSCPEPRAAFYLYPSFARWRKPLAARGVFTCQDLGHYLLENYEIAVLPGATFGDDPHALSLRLSTSFLDMETDEQAQSITTGFYDDPDADRFIHNQHPRLREVASRLADFVTELEEDFKP
jgi:aspartate/methionine/tyrosine aminotransferase